MMLNVNFCNLSFCVLLDDEFLNIKRNILLNRFW